MHKYNWHRIVKTMLNLTLDIFVTLDFKVSYFLSAKWELFCLHSSVFRSMFSDCFVSRGFCIIVPWPSFSICKIVVISLPAFLTLGTPGNKGCRPVLLCKYFTQDVQNQSFTCNSGNGSPSIQRVFYLFQHSGKSVTPKGGSRKDTRQ